MVVNRAGLHRAFSLATKPPPGSTHLSRGSGSAGHGSAAMGVTVDRSVYGNHSRCSLRTHPAPTNVVVPVELPRAARMRKWSTHVRSWLAPNARCTGTWTLKWPSALTPTTRTSDLKCIYTV